LKYLVISVDVEADWFRKELNSLTSMQGLFFLQDAAAKYGIPLTYLVTYECATREEAIRAIRPCLDAGLCEIGHHLHVWSTPPFENVNEHGVDTKWIDSVQPELSDDIFAQKMRCVHDAVVKNYGVVPTSHRAGRWALDRRTINWLEQNHYTVDTSVCPYMTYTRRGAGGIMLQDRYAFQRGPYYPDGEEVTRPSQDDHRRFQVLEVPVTGIRGDLFKNLDFPGIDRLRMFFSLFGYNGTRDIAFRPSYDLTFPVFKRLTQIIFQNNTFINFMLHSSELTLGTSPYSLTDRNLTRIKKKILHVLQTAKEYGIRGVRLSEVPQYYNSYCEQPKD
jgi:hypothetical protein